MLLSLPLLLPVLLLVLTLRTSRVVTKHQPTHKPCCYNEGAAEFINFVKIF